MEEIEVLFDPKIKNFMAHFCWITVHVTKEKVEIYFENKLLKTNYGDYNLLYYHNKAYKL